MASNLLDIVELWHPEQRISKDGSSGGHSKNKISMAASTVISREPYYSIDRTKTARRRMTLNECFRIGKICGFILSIYALYLECSSNSMLTIPLQWYQSLRWEHSPQYQKLQACHYPLLFLSCLSSRDAQHSALPFGVFQRTRPHLNQSMSKSRGLTFADQKKCRYPSTNISRVSDYINLASSSSILLSCYHFGYEPHADYSDIGRLLQIETAQYGNSRQQDRVM